MVACVLVGRSDLVVWYGGAWRRSDLVAGRVCWFGVAFGRGGLISGRISWLL